MLLSTLEIVSFAKLGMVTHAFNRNPPGLENQKQKSSLPKPGMATHAYIPSTQRNTCQEDSTHTHTPEREEGEGDNKEYSM